VARAINRALAAREGAIAPLIAHRRRQTGADRDVIHRVPPAFNRRPRRS
jgi:hypothetical protein